MRHSFIAPVLALGAVIFVACGGGPKPPTTPGGESTATTTPTTASTGTTAPTTSDTGSATPTATDDGVAQADRGAKLFNDNCASCHGDKGEGTKTGPAVVGKDALPKDPPKKAKYRKVKFETALDVANYVMKSMPADNPGGLDPKQYWDIMAFDLKANGVDVSGKHIDEKTTADIKLH
jgi:cytochrome c